MRGSLLALLVLLPCRSFAYTSRSISPAAMDITPGESVFVNVCSWPPHAAFALEDSAPEVAKISEPAPGEYRSSECDTFVVTGLAPGASILTARFAAGTVIQASVLVEPCENFPKVPSRTYVAARPGQWIDILAPVDVSGYGIFEWFEGEIGDESHPSGGTWYLSFYPREAKQYRCWVRVTDRCGTRRGEIIIDATIHRGRAVRH